MNKLILFITLLTSSILYAQAPQIQGDPLLCPDDCGTFTVDTADSYRWFSRPFGSDVASPVDTAGGREITICNELIPIYLSAELVRAGDTVAVPEILIDGLNFLPPFVTTTGAFTTGTSGETVVCPGDTVVLTLGDLTATNVTWFRNDTVVTSPDTTSLIVTGPGSYTVSSAPGACPDLLMPLGLTLEVVSCATTSLPGYEEIELPAPYPNPTSGEIIWSLPEELGHLNSSLYNVAGQRLWSGNAGSFATTFSFIDQPAGIYLLKLEHKIFRLIKR